MSDQYVLDDHLNPREPSQVTFPTVGPSPQGSLPLTDEMLRTAPSGDLFGMTQNAGMGWDPREMLGPQVLLLSTQGGVRAEDGRPIALGFHTGHWEVGLLVQAAAKQLKKDGAVPFAAFISDPCDGRTQGTVGMFDSLPFRNDAARLFGRQIRSLPTCRGVIGVATCDKGLPAMMMALAAQHKLPCVLVPGGVTLPTADAEDTAFVQTIGVRYVHGKISLEEAARAGCAACGSPGGGCQFLGTAATSQVIGEALGLTVPHAALAPSGQGVWLEMARQSALALSGMLKSGLKVRDILTDDAIHNAMVVHAACGGSTNLLLHLPAIAHAAGLTRPTVQEWTAVNQTVPRFVDVLPNGPQNHPTVRVFLAGGVPEIMLHLRRMGLLRLNALTVTGKTWDEVLSAWETSHRRRLLRDWLFEQDGIDPDDVILGPDRAREKGLTSTVCFPVGNICPEGSVIKATSIDPSVVDADGVYRHTGPARVFTSEANAMTAIKGQGTPLRPGDVLVLAGRGPMGSGMEETYQITSALKYLAWGRQVAVITDARFSGVSTGACIGHVGPEALAGGPLGRLIDGDTIEIIIDRVRLSGSVNLVGHLDDRWSPAEAQQVLATRTTGSSLQADPRLPDDTRLWAALQQVGGGTWGGCVYDVDRIVQILQGERP
ncbi:MAG: YjhG/YagF family D-xylonate dehydratase [Planctomycetota bacterium]|nr:YjhG/YagF family D-xylonate dehydratase [Planctomycetota bacterium]MDA1177793.1 YjhG/YagF family D-xylonate dehydratase [Planctomycetota bacterium]